ncbi:hypothetical protein BG015_009627 [Linnemannia schmuckeri]|uniref:Aminotransferase class V domain-containing protein n=1 Tax=Linnemannia schmuckeri TaxID=64567 RepID=A0A9P5RYS4_9FUNG|nr:hypothetical protein BG015_009627 [Linnemannia schmuckeri]
MPAWILTLPLICTPSSHPRIGPFARSLVYKGGVFISTHKFLGGPSTSGVMVARVESFSWAERHNVTGRNEFLSKADGGGMVDMMTREGRAQAGTLDILTPIRSGLVLRLQEIANPAWIIQKKYKLTNKVFARLLSLILNLTIRVLDASEMDRVAIFGVDDCAA